MAPFRGNRGQLESDASRYVWKNKVLPSRFYEFEFEWGFYALSVSKAIFRARRLMNWFDMNLILLVPEYLLHARSFQILGKMEICWAYGFSESHKIWKP